MAKHVRDVLAFVEHAKHNLKAGHVPHEELIVRQKLSRGQEGYKSPSPGARAALQSPAIAKRHALRVSGCNSCSHAAVLVSRPGNLENHWTP